MQRGSPLRRNCDSRRLARAAAAGMLGVVIIASAAVETTAGALQPSSWPVPPNYILGTQEIYGSGHLYNYTSDPMLVEQRSAVARLGANQMKIVLSSSKTCAGYGLDCDEAVTDLASLSAQPGLAEMLADTRISWYHFWLESFANPAWQSRDWTTKSLAAEYAETKAWAAYMLARYNGSGKVFMAGNWEGDWVLLGASGCKKPGGAFNLTCDPSPAATQRMIQWGKVRQQAIDDARADAVAAGVSNVTLLYYIEINLGPQALAPGSAGCASTSRRQAMCTSKPGVTNSVLPAVNPDLVSYSSYTCTNAYAVNGDVAAVDTLLLSTLDHIQAQLRPKPKTLGYHPLGFSKRVFIGEFGATPQLIPNSTFSVEYLARVYHAAIAWGAPMVLYWELYSNNSTIPLIAPPAPRASRLPPLSSPTVRPSARMGDRCSSALRGLCGSVGSAASEHECLLCGGHHQHELRADGCTGADLKTYCQQQAIIAGGEGPEYKALAAYFRAARAQVDNGQLLQRWASQYWKGRTNYDYV